MSEELKGEVKVYWNRESCDTHAAESEKFSREYFEEIESYRYFDQPFIHSFAQFSRYHGKRVLEVGFGAGTDFIQWLRAGAIATGIDLTEEGLRNLKHRIDTYGLPQPESIQTGDAENLPFEPDTFDLGYSFGVLHHTPDTPRAIAELVRVVRPGGEIKIMLYNRRSICVFNKWLKHGLRRGKFFGGLKWAAYHHIESEGTKAYSRKELNEILGALPLERIQVRTEATSADLLASDVFPPLNWCYRLMLRIAGTREAWYPVFYKSEAERRTPKGRAATGNPLGFFHCISARKKSAS